MGKLNIGVEIRDFDLERMGFSMSVLDQEKKRQSSEAYLRMTLPEMNTFLKALRAADEIDVATVDSVADRKTREAAPPAPRRMAGQVDDDRGFLARSIEEKIAADMLKRGATRQRAGQ